MSETYKVLGQALTGELALDGTTVKETVVYKVPAGKKASISAIELTNSGGSSTSYKVAYVPSAEVSTAVANVNYNVSTTTARYVSLGGYTNQAKYSVDGVTWQTTTLPIQNYSNLLWSKVTYLNGKYVALSSNSGLLASSTNGITWTVVSVSPGMNDIAYLNGTYVMVGAYGYDTLAYSTDAVNWTISNVSPGSQWSWTSVTSGVGKFVAIATNNRAAYSTDGVNWSVVFLPPSSYNNTWSSITYGNGLFVAATNYQQIGSAYTTASSTDGINWVGGALPDNKAPNFLTFINNKFYLSDMYSNSLFTSVDGVTWDLLSVYASFSSITYGANGYVAYTGQPATFTSTDGVTWTMHWGVVDTYSKGAYASITTTQTLTQSIPASLNKHVAIYNKPITSNVTHELTGGVTLSEGDEIRVYSTSTALIAHVYGVELTSNINYKILGQLYYGAEVIHHPGTPGTPGDNGYGYGYGYGGGNGTPGTDPWDESLIEPQVLYTVPAGVQTTSTAIYVTNHDSTTRTYDLAVVPSGETLSLKHHIRWDMPVSPSDFDIVSAKLTLAAGDKVYVFPSTVDKVGFTAFGLEK